MSNLCHPLYITGRTEAGNFLLGGIYTLKATHGFPVDASFDECKRLGYKIDWCEALCSAFVDNYDQWEALAKEAILLHASEAVQQWNWLIARLLHIYPRVKSQDNPIACLCKLVLTHKRRGKALKIG